MKKSIVLIAAAFFIIAGLVVTGCAGTGSSQGGAAPVVQARAPGDLGAFRLMMTDGFEWDANYNGTIIETNLFNGHQVIPGETYTLKVTYTASRDLENHISVVIVDSTEAASWWTELSVRDDEATLIPASKAGEEVSALLTFTTIAEATGTSSTANSMAFLTEGEGIVGRQGSGVKGPFFLTFSEFVLTKVN